MFRHSCCICICVPLIVNYLKLAFKRGEIWFSWLIFKQGICRYLFDCKTFDFTDRNKYQLTLFRVGGVKSLGFFYHAEPRKNVYSCYAASLNLINSEKDASRTRAIEIFPYFSSQLSKKKDCNKADAILIASFYYETYKIED